MREMVQYSNDFNFLPMPKLTEREMDMVVKILSKLADDRSVKIDIYEFFSDLRNEKESTNKMLEMFKGLSDKILNYNIKYTTATKAYAFVCFEKLVFDYKTNTIEITAQQDFYELITNYQLGFTRFELLEFINISSKYAKTLYRLLKQFRNSGVVTLFRNRWDDFCEIMQIPSEYAQGKIDERILKPCIKELSGERDLFNNNRNIFENLTYKKIKDPNGRGRGGKVIGIEFYFTPEKDRSELSEKIKDLKSLKKHTEPEPEEAPKINPLTGEIVTELTPYFGRHFSMKNKFDGGYDSCKLQDVWKGDDDKIHAKAINQENNKIFDLKFESLQHMINSLKFLKLVKF